MKRLLPILLLLLAFVAPAGAAVGDVTLPLCSAAVHDSHKTAGPDGLQYATWHPQIDAKNACHFDHEHGSSPALLIPSSRKFGGGLWPAYGYTATKHGMPEPHAGFKSYVFDDLHGHDWMLTHHFGTSNSVGAACNRFHTFDVVIKDRATGALLIDTHAMADHGRSLDNVSGAALTPPNCSTQGNIVSPAARRLPVQTSGGVAYEPWTFELPGNILGFGGNLISVNTPNAQMICNDLTCSANIATTNNGAIHFLQLNNGVGWSTGVYSGTFYTDAHATTILSDTDPLAVEQFVAPGVSITLPLMTCRAYDGQVYIMGCADIATDEDLFKFNPFVTGAN